MPCKRAPLCPGCRKRTRCLGSFARNPDPGGSDDMYECWTEDCSFMGVEALPQHWAYFRKQAARMRKLEKYIKLLEPRAKAARERK